MILFLIWKRMGSCLNTWSSVAGSIWERWRRVTIEEGIYHCGQPLWFPKSHAISTVRHSASCLWSVIWTLNCFYAIVPACLDCRPLKPKAQLNDFFCKLPWWMCFVTLIEKPLRGLVSRNRLLPCQAWPYLILEECERPLDFGLEKQWNIISRTQWVTLVET